MHSSTADNGIPSARSLPHTVLQPDLGLDPLEAAIVHTVAYADVFDYPLTPEEIHRYLIRVPASLADIQNTLDISRRMLKYLACHEGYVTLRDREAIVGTRRQRARVAASLWPRAVRHAATIAHLPFVRMVAVSGALCMHNAEAGSDMDYFIVTEPGRLWLCRAAIVGLVRLAARAGDKICPNFLLSERALLLQEHNLFMAHELLQMTPVIGQQTYQQMWRLNAWASVFMPNAYARAGCLSAPALASHPIRSLIEAPLRTPVGGWLEAWEMRRKIEKFSRSNDGHGSATFCSDWCKGHFLDHGQRALDAFVQRLQKLEQA